jgi:hypothetical protein
LSKALSKKNLDDKIIQAGMFNDKGSDAARNLKLRELIQMDMAQDEPDSDQEDDIMRDEELNIILARSLCIECQKKGFKKCPNSDHELDLFNKMDEERYVLEEKDTKIA